MALKAIRRLLLPAVVAALALAGCRAPAGENVATATPRAGASATQALPPGATPSPLPSALATGESTAAPTGELTRPAPPTPAPATPVADSPAAGICAGGEGPLVTVMLGGRVPTPRCLRVRPEQRLAVQNDYAETITVSLGGIDASVPPGKTYEFERSLGEFLATGVHRLSGPGSSGLVEIWVVSGPAGTPEPPATAETPQAPEQVFFYGSDMQPEPEMFAWSVDGSFARVGRAVFPGAIASRSGRWVATPNGYPDPGGVRVYDLETGTTADYAATERYRVYGLAFDPAETRLAFLELAPADVKNIPWAIVVVRLEDGRTTRFQGSTLPALNRYPGNPLGWTASGGELLIATFLPYSDGPHAGVWALALPPDAQSGMITSLTPRLLVPGGGYRSTPRISPDGTRLVYLARDPEYMPADYEPVEDFAANQLWTLDLAGAQPALEYEATNGDALLRDAAWSPDGAEILFAQGHFSGPDFGTLSLKALDGAGEVRAGPAVPLAAESYPAGLWWCRDSLALLQWVAREPMLRLEAVDPGGTGEWWSPVVGKESFMVGCVE